MALTEWVLLLPEIVALATYPDRVPAPPRSPALRSFSADPLTVLPPLPATSYPDAIRRPRPTAGTSAALPPQPENTVALDWQGSYPSAVSRPRAPTPVAVYLPPDPEQTEAGWRGWHPDALPRPRRAQPLAEVLPPRVETPALVPPCYPDRIARGFLGPSWRSYAVYPLQPVTPFVLSPCPNLYAALVPMPAFTAPMVAMPVVAATVVPMPAETATIVPMPALNATDEC